MYTIRLLSGNSVMTVLERLENAVNKSRFTSDFRIDVDRRELYLPRVRLRGAKEYCGNHPGPCVVGPFGGVQKKTKRTFLEWDDWVEFHGIVNTVLDRLRASADVWSKPQDAKGRFFMRKGPLRRESYDYDEEYVRNRGLLRVWNLGTDDQFAKTPTWEKEKKDARKKEEGRRQEATQPSTRPRARQEGGRRPSPAAHVRARQAAQRQPALPVGPG